MNLVRNRVTNILLIAALGAVVLACGCATPAQRASRLAARAKTALRNRQPAAAVIELRNATELQPKSAALHLSLAGAYAANQQFGPALAEYRQVEQLRPQDPAAWLAAGQILLAGGEPAKAQAAAQAVLAHHPDDSAATVLLAAALLRQKQAPAARKLLGALVRRQPRFEPGWLAYGAAAAAAGDFPTARDAWEHALQLKPNSLSARRNLAALDLGQQRPADAEQELLAAVAANPKSAAAEHDLAAFYESQHHPRRAEAALETAARLARHSPQAEFALASFYLRQHQTERAHAIDAALGTKAPNFLPARVQRIEIDFAAKRYARAQALADRLVQEYPTKIRARLLRARLELARGKASAALTDLSAAQRLQPGLAAVSDLMGQAYTRLGQGQKAMQAYQRALSDSPRDATAAAALAGLLLNQGHPNQALNYASQAARWAPGLAGAWLASGDAEARLRQPAQAETDWKRAEQLAPQLPGAALRLGGLYLEEKNYRPAEDQFQQALRLAPGDPAAVAGLARVAMAQGHNAAAIQTVRQQIARQETAPLDDLLGSVYAQQHDDAAAQAAFERAVRLAPGSLEPYMLLAAILLHEHRLSQAQAEYAAAAQRHPQDARLWTLQGILAAQRGDRAQARQDYERALAIAPYSGTANNNLAYLDAEDGTDLTQALVMAQRALHALPRVPTVADTLATVYIRLRLYASAIPLLQGAVRAKPDNASFRLHLAAALYGNGNKPQARAELSRALRLDATLRQQPEARQILSGH